MSQWSDPSWDSGADPIVGADEVVGLQDSSGLNKRWTFTKVLAFISAGLAGTYATIASVTAGLATKADDAATTAALATKADSSAVTAAIAALDQSNPLNVQIIRDEFFFSSTESGEHGELGWSITNGTMNVSNPVANHPGICARASTAVAGVIASMYSGGGGASPVVRIDQLDEQQWVIMPQSAVADHDVRIGYSTDFTAAAAGSAVYFEKLQTDTNWFAVCRSGGVETRTDTGVAYAASWFRLKIRRISATSFGFTVNGGTEVVVSTNVPGATTVFIFGNHIIPQTANARTIWFDFFSMRLLAQTRA